MNIATGKVMTKYGAVVILDALGASNFNEKQVKEFLSTRSEINQIVKGFAKSWPGKERFLVPIIYTFGDTIILITRFKSNLSNKLQLLSLSMIMRRYLFHAMQRGILFRGAFSIGKYIEDSVSNTVMGPAVTDAAAWYDKSDWMGLSCTPQAKNIIDFYLTSDGGDFSNVAYLIPYKVPFKNGITKDLYTVAWPFAFFDEALLKHAGNSNAKNILWK